ncbi:uncharacterized protein A1O9_06672 [Exophiala aquamarina CBS 119918]|uniref:Altered inheritance of mitochondria protein 11 n=1 Tax=Exophiala aquamarina CBS 119918 TaxID=1182545 RepID=A0A072PFY1_9EURO|nr:uncharacterized protein A1O9_06672 [Exophiala aquamarina CBS 119918]KEF58746.1 hypothetical protein A1O9_06672 [Exophiala aquamarina CBS 119918]
MSWLTNWFATSKITSLPPQPATDKPRLLEEPAPKPELPSSQTALTEPQSTPQQAPRAERPHRSKVILGAGIAFFGLSLLITRRAFARKRFTNPGFYASSPEAQAEQAKKINGAVEALEALNIATINVASVAMIGTGSAMWYLDINSMEDVRRLVRGGAGVDGTGRTEKEAEEEFEEWMATTLARKEKKESGAGERKQ